MKEPSNREKITILCKALLTIMWDRVAKQCKGRKKVSPLKGIRLTMPKFSSYNILYNIGSSYQFSAWETGREECISKKIIERCKELDVRPPIITEIAKAPTTLDIESANAVLAQLRISPDAGNFTITVSIPTVCVFEYFANAACKEDAIAEVMDRFKATRARISNEGCYMDDDIKTMEFEEGIEPTVKSIELESDD